VSHAECLVRLRVAALDRRAIDSQRVKPVKPEAIDTSLENSMISARTGSHSVAQPGESRTQFWSTLLLDPLLREH
jgi:hypothetical protein